MPLYLIDSVDESGQGPFENRAAIAALEDNDLDEQVVVEIGEHGEIVKVTNVVDYLEESDETEE